MTLEKGVELRNRMGELSCMGALVFEVGTWFGD